MTSDTETCQNCDGTGEYYDADDQVHTCPACRGTGRK
jgi:DnaJ-class molecular chaperone